MRFLFVKIKLSYIYNNLVAKFNIKFSFPYAIEDMIQSSIIHPSQINTLSNRDPKW